MHSNDRFSVDGEQIGVEAFRGTIKPLTITGLSFGRPPKKLGSIDSLIDWLPSFVARHKAEATPKIGNGYSGNGPDLTASAEFHRKVGSFKGMGWSVEQIVDELAQDPAAARYVAQNRLEREVNRSFEKYVAQDRAQAHPALQETLDMPSAPKQQPVRASA